MFSRIAVRAALGSAILAAPLAAQGTGQPLTFLDLQHLKQAGSVAL